MDELTSSSYISTILSEWMHIKELTVNFLTSYLQHEYNTVDLAPLIAQSLMMAVELEPKLMGNPKKEMKYYLYYFGHPEEMLMDNDKNTNNKEVVTSADKIFGLIRAIRNALESLNLLNYTQIEGDEKYDTNY